MYVQAIADAPAGQPAFETITAFGHLCRIVSVALPAHPDIRALTSPMTLVYGLVEPITPLKRDDLGLGVVYFTRHAALRWVEISHINCLVGRFSIDLQSRHWVIVDRSGAVSQNALEDGT